MKFTSPATTSNVRTDGFRITWMSDQDVRSEDHGEGGGGGGGNYKTRKGICIPGLALAPNFLLPALVSPELRLLAPLLPGLC